MGRSVCVTRQFIDFIIPFPTSPWWCRPFHKQFQHQAQAQCSRLYSSFQKLHKHWPHTKNFLLSNSSTFFFFFFGVQHTTIGCLARTHWLRLLFVVDSPLSMTLPYSIHTKIIFTRTNSSLLFLFSQQFISFSFSRIEFLSTFLVCSIPLAVTRMRLESMEKTNRNWWNVHDFSFRFSTLWHKTITQCNDSDK